MTLIWLVVWCEVVRRVRGARVVRRGLAAVVAVAIVGGSLAAMVVLAQGVSAARGIDRVNSVRWLLDTVARALSWGTIGLFAAPNRSVAVLVNSGIAAVVWLGIASVVAVLARAAADPPREARARGWARRGWARRRRGGATSGRARSATPRARRILFITVAVLTVLETAGFAGSYFGYSRHFVTTDNAQVDGDKIEISAPVNGTLTGWSIEAGSRVEPNQVVGRIQVVGSGAQPQRTIKVPGVGTGTVAIDDVVNGAYVTAGTELAAAYDFSKVYVTARVEDYDIAAVHAGALVDIDADAYPHTPITGVVEVVENSTAGNFTIYPPAGIADPSQPQRADQYIPVKIALVTTGGARLVPGMNLTVHIHKT